jgi:hypothetical protein
VAGIRIRSGFQFDDRVRMGFRQGRPARTDCRARFDPLMAGVSHNRGEGGTIVALWPGLPVRAILRTVAPAGE